MSPAAGQGVAVVTGGARGLGRAYARRLADDGFDIAILDCDDASEALAEVRATGRSGDAWQLDVSSPEEVEEVAAAVRERCGRVDVLVNNAGVFPHVPFEALGYEEWRRVLDVNLTGPFLTAKAFVPEMKERGWGRIVNVASATCWLVIPTMAHYIASKSGVVGLTRALATELGGDGITANVIAPGLIRTPGTEAGPEAGMFDQVSTIQPIGRVGAPEDLAGTVSFLASEASAFMTGQVLLVDGGVVRL